MERLRTRVRARAIIPILVALLNRHQGRKNLEASRRLPVCRRVTQLYDGTVSIPLYVRSIQTFAKDINAMPRFCARSRCRYSLTRIRLSTLFTTRRFLSSSRRTTTVLSSPGEFRNADTAGLESSERKVHGNYPQAWLG